MKRGYGYSTNICSIERRMRKKAAMDLQHEQSKKENTTTTFPNIHHHSKGSLDSLPSGMIHLGGENFISVVHFLGQTRVHIRKYICDKDGFYHPTKDGISLSPAVWNSMRMQLNGFARDKPRDNLIVVDRDLCVSKQTKDGEQVFTFQRLFQRKDMCFQFVPERVVITDKQYEKICISTATIESKIQKDLLKYSLPYYINKELSAMKQDSLCYETTYGRKELMDSLGMCLSQAITLKINEIIDCSACSDSDTEQFTHICLKTRDEKFEDYFERALYSLDWRDVAKDFVKRNINVDIQTSFSEVEFFDILNVNDLFNYVEHLYVEKGYLFETLSSIQ